MILTEKCIDFHTHPIPEAFREAMKELGIDVMEEDGFPLPAWSVQEHLRFMADAGISHSVLTLPAPHIHNGSDGPAIAAARRINEEMASYVKNDPDHFSFCACLPLPAVSGTVDEIRHAYDDLGAIGVKVPTNANGVYLGDPELDPVMEELNRRNALVIIHPCRARKIPDNVITSKVMAVYEYPADTTRAVINMIANRIMSRYPQIRWIVPHTGSFLAWELQRFKGVSGILASLKMMETVNVEEEVKNLYYDIAGDPEPLALEMLMRITDEKHIVYGSDWPHSPSPIVFSKKKHLEENSAYAGILEKIMYQNGEDLLKAAKR